MQVQALLRSITVAAACIVSSVAWAETGHAEASAASSNKAIIQSFRDLGLKPAGEKGYLQTLRFRTQALVPERSSITLTAAGGSIALALGQDAALDMSVLQPHKVQADLAFVGYGLPAVMGGRDDFLGQDLRGKIAVYIDATPLFLTADQARNARILAHAAAERAGAVGLIAIDLTDERWSARRQAWPSEGRYLADSSLQATRAPQLTGAIGPAMAETLFAAAGRDFATIVSAARAGRPLPGFALAGAVQATIETRTRAGAVDAVVAMLPGADAFLARNSVVLSAKVSDAQSLIRLAGEAAAAGASKRSIVFALLPEEIRADLAARAVVDRLGASRDSIVAAIHLEGAADSGVAVAAATESSLGETARTLAANFGISLRDATDSTAAAGFALAGAPSIGLQASGAEPYLSALTRAIANGAQRPSWKLDSPFAPPAPRAQENVIAPLEMPVGKRPQRLLPTYGALAPVDAAKAA